MTLLTEPTRFVFKNYGTPTAIAGVAPTLDYRFALDRSELDAVTLTDKLTLTRAATAAFTNLGGNLQLASANVPRFDHNVSTRQSLGLLVEEQRTNLLLRSEEFGTTWTTFRASVSADATTAPNGSTTADKIVEDTTATNSHGVQQLSLSFTSGTSYTFSVYVKAAERANIRIALPATAFTLALVAQFNLTLATTTALTAGATATISALPDGWYRCAVTAIATATATGGVSVSMGETSASTTINYTGNGTSGLFLWGGQLEAGATASSYTPTTSATVTRTETATVSLAGLPATRTLVEKPVGCATVAGDTLTLNTGYTAERVMIFPAALTGTQVTDIRGAM